MADALPAWRTVRSELERALAAVRPETVDRFAASVQPGNGRLFFSGQGRSGLLGQMAAMRFMHLGFAAHAAGEATTPSIRAGDTLVVISGSGRSLTSVEHARTAAAEGATVLLVTQRADSPARAAADEVFVIDADDSVQFGNTLFEHVVLLLIDSVALFLMGDIDDPVGRTQHNHANLQ